MVLIYMKFLSKSPTGLEIMLCAILIIKLVFLYSLIRVRTGKKHGVDEDTLEKYENLESITHNLFFISMSLLIIYLFRPHALSPKPVLVDGETKTFLFLFAVLTLLGINYKKLQKDFVDYKKNF